MVVTSDLATDQRVQRHATLLAAEGHEVTLVGRMKKNSLMFSPHVYYAVRLKLGVEKGKLFYVLYNIRLFWFLLFSKSDVIWANDLDTLLPAYLISILKSKLLIYDTHEYFTGVPELQKRTLSKDVWRKLERWLLPKIKYGMTVSNSVARQYYEDYNVSLKVIRNIPSLLTADQKEELPLLPDQPFILYQGALNLDRGLEELICAMQELKSYSLVIAGKGDVEEELKFLVTRLNLQRQVWFLGMVQPAVLRQITKLALVGVSIEKPTNPNYEMCLPNKLFDYIQAGIPIVAYPHQEIKMIVDTYQCGTYIQTHDPVTLAKELDLILSNTAQLSSWREASRKAAVVLNWEKESVVFTDWFNQVIEENKNRL
ncbi:MAG TPA: glycosyltransferase [Cytophagaceae bacterium]|nr:glycosyltransferase [Cytophagaceae bacterium]